MNSFSPTFATNEVPFFSVCIPQYNRTSFLIEALTALAGQTFKNFEVCISDDCSSDGRQTELEQALREFGMPYVFRRQPRNLRYDGNLRTAIGLASGTYCLLMGNDDRLAEPETLERLNSLIIKEENIGVVITNYLDQTTQEIYRRVRATRIVGFGPLIAERNFRNFSFVSGIILRRDRAVAHATTKWDGAEMYQMYVGSRIIAEGYALMEVEDVSVVQGIQIPGQTVDSYAAKPRLYPCPIQERKTPLTQMGRLVIDAIRPYSTKGVSALGVSIFFQIFAFPYAFWLLEYRRVQSWNYSFGICLGMRPRNVLANTSLHWPHSLFLRSFYLIVTFAGLIMPLRLFDFLRSRFYAFAKSAFRR
ncbi:MAG: glycosyltransferase [Acidobacteriota bacterium]|nr:glycosyltransferase [Acidobacteriota bacterium]